MRRLALGLFSLALACNGESNNSSAASGSTGADLGSTSAPGSSSDSTGSSLPTTGASSGVVDTGDTGDTGASTGSVDASTTAVTGASSSGVSSDSSSGAEGSSSSTGEPPEAFAPASLVVLGDSISDGGGQPPFYYNLLRDDLAAKYGPGFKYVNNAQSGSETGALLGQAKGLPKQLPGPVAVVITSGGNDMKAALPQVLGGLDGPIKQKVAANVDAALAELLAPDRFGAGVLVRVFEGNIYDASDGQGNFSQGKCAFGKGLPAIPTDMYFDAWNLNIRDVVLARDQTAVDMHAHFYDHGYNNPPNWYASDCTHPSTLGHDQLRHLFYFEITGEMLP
ncbi:SGNH/GDSL hydrolase family protein [Nannocystis sp.]|uniref:SGNH/GDSL hydrolase family protein n=1 Tax=Nannocystis sp. TaxID=1962667 RepID=UPI0024248628|nr:SGNH/GDSL hydrolase family protein [Nannocystis sp.]MBK7830650.1 SGNH/GDSL hydrolase family protein [Nannocystis sp.]MBK9756182.1 SGNH/GDSL hydrolase family protein [Nannocystis sp.]